MVCGDAKSLQGISHLYLMLFKLPWLRLCQMERVQFKGLHGLGKLHWQQPLTAHHLFYTVAVRRLGLQDAPDQFLARFRHPGRHCVRPIQDVALQLGHRFGTEGHGAGHHEEEHDPECPDVHANTYVVFVSEELRGSIRGRTAEGVEGLVATADGAEAKVSHFNTGATRVKNILCFQVSVNDVIVMLQNDKEKLLLTTKYIDILNNNVDKLM